MHYTATIHMGPVKFISTASGFRGYRQGSLEQTHCWLLNGAGGKRVEHANQAKERSVHHIRPLALAPVEQLEDVSRVPAAPAVYLRVPWEKFHEPRVSALAGTLPENAKETDVTAQDQWCKVVFEKGNAHGQPDVPQERRLYHY